LDISEIPYEKKHIYILRDFDEATREAMNATLKILEEPPEYAIIALVVKNPESLLETIHSRTLNLFR
jgi:DNA polymerase III subunit delta'